ncbi:MAG: putative membrane protein insertion efficiency factor [Ilumatobacter sp.]|jgi:putative membrane protein insertion efficiency factor
MTRGQVVELPITDLLAEITDTTEICLCPGHGHREQGRSAWSQRQLLGAIVLYQRAREGRLSPCRFFPSCSEYALQSVEVHGAWRGGWLSVRRLLRCRPLGPSGVDLVPAGSSATSRECCGAGSSALLTPIVPTVMSSTQQKGG